MKTLIISISLTVATLALDSHAESQEPGTNPDRITVSGVSSGANMAHQLHLAYPEIFSGAGIVTGGPFGCAQGSVTTAFANCMAQAGPDLDAETLSARVESAAQSDDIGNPELLADDRVWLFHGKLDAVVAHGVVDATANLYREFLPSENLRYVTEIAAAHTFPTLDQGPPCDVSEPPFIGACGYDTAGEILRFLYPGMSSPTDREYPGPVEVAIEGQDAGLGNSAWLFVPTECTAPDAQCGLHLVLHGCNQSHSQVEMQFMTMSGYLPWAAANDIVLAFPQVAPSAVNPLACWDWWGYTGADYLSRSGPQMKFLADWVRELAGLGD